MATKDNAGLTGNDLLARLKDDAFQRLMRDYVERDGYSTRGFDFQSDYVTPFDVSQFKARSAEPRPEVNSKHLMTPAGDLYVVIGGIAWYYGSWDVYRRVHYGCYTRTRRVGNTTVRERTCPRHYAVQSMNWIATAFMDAACQLRRSPYANADIYFVHNGLKHLITAPASFNNYQFDWDDVGGPMLSAEFDSLETGVMLHETTGGRFD